jgi:hypothetical protein
MKAVVGVVKPMPNPKPGGSGYLIDVSSMGDPTSSYATAGIDLRIM